MDESAIAFEETEFMVWGRMTKWNGKGETVDGIVIIRFGEKQAKGRKVSASINDVSEIRGEKANCHGMRMGTELSSDKPMNAGQVAVKITGPKADQTAAPVMATGGHFGVDVSRPTKGSPTFQLGRKLTDGKKRQ